VPEATLWRAIRVETSVFEGDSKMGNGGGRLFIAKVRNAELLHAGISHVLLGWLAPNLCCLVKTERFVTELIGNSKKARANVDDGPCN